MYEVHHKGTNMYILCRRVLNFKLRKMLVVCNIFFYCKIISTIYLNPGYSALFRHPNDELNYCVYIIPGNPQVGNDDLPYWHDNIMKNDPYVSRALGDKAKVERMKVGWYKSYNP